MVNQMLTSLLQKKFEILGISALLTAMFGVHTLPASAVSFVTDRTVLGGNDTLNWSRVGRIFNLSNPDPSDFLPNTFSVTSANGLEVSVDLPLPSSSGITFPFIFQTSSDAPTNFSAGDFILVTGFTPGEFPSPGNSGPLTLTFDTPVFGVGTQIAVDDTPSYELFVSAFDRNDNLLGSFSTFGISSTELDGSASFLGVRSDTRNITKLVYSSSEANRAFGINSLNIVTTIPENSLVPALSLLIIGGLAFSVRSQSKF